MRETQAIRECKAAYDNYRRRYVIQDKVPDAIWDFPIIRPEKPKHITKIEGYNKPKEERKFPYYSKKFIEKMEVLGRSDDKQDAEEFNRFVTEEWRRRYEGFFFFNGDILEYVTGRHYCTLQYWKVESTKNINGVKRKGRHQPNFRDNQRDLFYALDYARNDPNCAGLCYISNRRSGKTSSVLSDSYWDTTENYESRLAIQSKTKDDSDDVFAKLVDSWRLIPYWFKPEDTGRTGSKSELLFGERTKANVDIKDRSNRDVLNSWIRPFNSKESALDGKYCSYIVNDECGKPPKGLDISERWNVNKECLMDGSDIIGFNVSMSTVEDMDKYGSKSFKKLWERSEVSGKLINNRTDSGLYQFFIPAYYGFPGETNEDKFIDEWGYSNIAAAKKYHRSVYESKTGDDLLSYQRKYPLCIQDCWVTNDGKNNFSTVRLIQQKIWNESTSYQDVVKGNFMWRNGIKWGTVDWYPDDNGRWQVAWMPDDVDRNRFEVIGNQKKPTRNFCVTGIDPFSHGKVVNPDEGSNGAAVTILKSYQGTKIKEGIVCIYDYRTAGDANKQIEDYIMQCLFYSSPVLAESNISIVVNGFQDKGYYGFLEYNPLETDLRKLNKGLKGFATTSVENIESLISMSASFILDNIGKHQDGSYGFCPFNDLVDQWLDFNPEKRTPYDLVIAAGLAIVLARAKKTPPTPNLSVKSAFHKIGAEGQAALQRMMDRAQGSDRTF